MWGRKSPIEEYLDKYPDSSLREYNEYVKEEERPNSWGSGGIYSI